MSSATSGCGTDPVTLSRKDFAALRRLAVRNYRYGSGWAAYDRLRNLGFCAAHRTQAKKPPGLWTWTITPAGRAYLARVGSSNATQLNQEKA